MVQRQLVFPGLIIEHSFHTQTRATKWLLDNANLDKLAEAEATIIAKHYGLSKTSTNVSQHKKTITEIAKEVIAGVWGNGQDRKNKLTSAGYDYSAVQKKVKELLK